MRKAPGYFQAFALGLPQGDDSPPVLTARGEYALADEIVRIARRLGVPVVEREELCAALSTLPVEQQIPAGLFQAAAALFAEVRAIASLCRPAPSPDR